MASSGRWPADRLAVDALAPESNPDALQRSIPRSRLPSSSTKVGSARAGGPVVVKVETVNPIRAFKGRGTWHAIAGLVGEGTLGPDRPVVVASTGNFGQGVAFAGRAHGVPVTVFADEHANPRKLEPNPGARGDGRPGRPGLRRARAARRPTPDNGAHLLVDGEDPRIAAGAGTLALELTDAIAAGHCRRSAPRTSRWATARSSSASAPGCGEAPACRVIGSSPRPRRR